MKTVIYIPYTVYHLLLVFAIAMEKKAQNVLFIEDIDYMRKTLSIFNAVFPDVSFEVNYYQSTEKVGNLQSHWCKKHNLKLIEAAIARYDNVSDFYYSCEFSVYTTFLSHLLKCKKQVPVFHFVEDGMATYTQYKLKDKNCFGILLDKMIFGSWHKSPSVQGMLNLNAQLEVLFPDMLPSIYDNAVKNKINASALFAKFQHNGLRQFIDDTAIKHIESIFILDKLNFKSTGSYIDIIHQKVLEENKKGHTVAIKKHPADGNNSLIEKNLGKNSDFMILPYELPIEIYFFLLRDNIKFVIGGLSTGMLTARWLLPNAKITAIVTKGNKSAVDYYKNIIELFNKVSIDVDFI